MLTEAYPGITVLVENDVADQHAALVAEWGLSVHIKHQAKQILFTRALRAPLCGMPNGRAWT